MLHLETLIASLPERPDAAAILEGFVPPARFAAKRFDNYDPRDPSQAAAGARLRSLAVELREDAAGGLVRRLLGRRSRGGGVYLDGGFGVGKTHLLAAFWNDAPAPKAYLSFDELVSSITLVRGEPETWRSFTAMRVVAVDEWELDDPGNLRLATSIVRDLFDAGVTLATTSNTLPLDLGKGRFTQKDFRAEIEELAARFEVITVAGDDFRHRHYETTPGAEYFVDDKTLDRHANAVGVNLLIAEFDELLSALGDLHPLRYRELVRRVDGVCIRSLSPLVQLPDALRFVHFIDALYNSAVPLQATSTTPLSGLFPPAFAGGAYGKKMSRCLSRLEELFVESTSNQ